MNSLTTKYKNQTESKRIAAALTLAPSSMTAINQIAVARLFSS
jgi:hypothetical protein